MLCIKHHSTDAFFNIATDEYIFKHLKEDCFMLWRNDNAIIVGKHQNTQAEINHEYVKERGIKVVRRLSGGGAVFHDLGNLNFSFTRTGDSYEMIDFERYTKPIIEVLKELGVNAKFEGRNDLTIEGKKFSGNAEHVFKNKVLHHGTLLFSSEMKDISGALKINPLKYKDRGVKSVPNRVTNISDHLPKKISLDEFTDKVMNYITSSFPDARMYEFTEEDLAAIQKIRDDKYSTWEWNFGYSPDYNFRQGARTTGGTVEMNMNVANGVIQEVKITGDFFHIRDISPIEQALKNTKHNEEEIRSVLKQFDLEEYFSRITEDDLVAIMF
ncbi:lipoate--protein ligase [Salinimicrobium oceani]|uniref:lipoate--protein ligase n=1 Tax=Salinimicrobium oceani TaxID=2722702 RepID=A0ABX1CYM9_9FLAO|nr:lipoate--protein ligase [Salinimicrobium oceani]NJW52044.1 lipoate--protein ligase [Salinimicrobium oceani]